MAKNNPIPAPIPNFKLFGIEFINHALKGVREIIKNINYVKTEGKFNNE